MNIKPIRTEQDYQQALKTIEPLFDRENLTPDEMDFLDVTSALIENYESKHYPIDLPDSVVENYGITDFDTAEYLENDELIALYLAETLRTGTDEEFIQALNTVARTKGMNELAQKTGIGRESLYQTLSSSKPRFETVQKILKGLNIELVPRIKTA